MPGGAAPEQADGHSAAAHTADHGDEPSPSDDPPDAADFTPGGPGDPEPDDAQ